MTIPLRHVDLTDPAIAMSRRWRCAYRPHPKPVPLRVQSLEPRLPLDAAAGVAPQAVAALADTVAPEVRSVTPPKSQTYAAGKTLSFKVNFTERVVVTGTPTLPITIGSAARQAVWNGKGSGGRSLTFTTVVQTGDLAPTGVQIAGPLGLADGTAISDRAGNPLIPAATGTFPKAKVDAVGPRVTEFSSPIISGKIVSLRVTLDEAARVTGKPSIPFTLAGVAKQFVYVSGGGQKVLTFRYKAAKQEVPTAETVVISTPTIALGSGRITDVARNAATSLTPPDAPTPDTWMQFVTVGDAGNAADDSIYGAYGSVDYVYRIGKFEVTIGQYAEFLNAVARNDTHGLYNVEMGTDLHVAGISRSGRQGSYTYTVMDNGGSSANRPITYVNWFDAARFANWMHNGRPSGPQGTATTEDGAYTLNGATSGAAPTRNAGAQYCIPTENEWYKAAYYRGGGTNADYWYFATQSDDSPGNVIGSTPNQASYFSDVYALTQTAELLPRRNYLTNVGAFTNSASYYGTFDQSGSVFEWNELSDTVDTSQLYRGGGWNGTLGAMEQSSSLRILDLPSSQGSSIGFRLASSL